MERFSWQSARSVPQAASLATTTVADAMLADPTADSVILKAGGIDVLDLMKENLLRPGRLVNLREIPGLDAIAEDDAGVRIGAMATLQQVASHPVLRQRYTALADAAGSSASPQIRNVATLGGNLLQRPRCWYFRSAAHYCARKGGDPCFAFVGENQYHAVFAQYGCAIVHPSTAATALVAFGAHVELMSAQGASRSMPLAEFLVGPETDMTRENRLRAGEVLTAVVLPPVSAGTRSVFLKQAPRIASAQTQLTIVLPPPRADFGKSLGEALRLRRSTRSFDPRPLPPQVLSELLWAAYGVNRPATADRTAPSWRHARETDVYAATADGVWRYDAVKHALVPQLAVDVRGQTGVQDFVGTAPLNLVYVSNAEHLSGVSREEQHRVAAADIGFIGQNVYLYCASEGLACVFRASLDTDRLARTLGLSETQFIMFAQTVGYERA
jgi:xanthine dehydrogenase YagS FAD-binding subunit